MNRDLIPEAEHVYSAYNATEDTLAFWQEFIGVDSRNLEGTRDLDANPLTVVEEKVLFLRKNKRRADLR